MNKALGASGDDEFGVRCEAGVDRFLVGVAIVWRRICFSIAFHNLFISPFQLRFSVPSVVSKTKMLVEFVVTSSIRPSGENFMPVHSTPSTFSNLNFFMRSSRFLISKNSMLEDFVATASKLPEGCKAISGVVRHRILFTLSCWQRSHMRIVLSCELEKKKLSVTSMFTTFLECPAKYEMYLTHSAFRNRKEWSGDEWTSRIGSVSKNLTIPHPC